MYSGVAGGMQLGVSTPESRFWGRGVRRRCTDTLRRNWRTTFKQKFKL